MKNYTTIDAVILSYKREENLPKVIRGVRKQSMVRDIIVIHNKPSNQKYKGVKNIFLDKNYGCISRHAISLLSDATHLFFVDDDIYFKNDLSQIFLSEVCKNFLCLIGLFGADVSCHQKQKPGYGLGGAYVNESFVREVDIVRGAVHLCSRSLLINSFRFIGSNPACSLANEDDVLLNLAANFYSGIVPKCLPSSAEDFEYLSSPFAVCSDKNHVMKRDKLINRFIEIGWKQPSIQPKVIKRNTLSGGRKYTFNLHRKVYFFLKENVSLKELGIWVTKKKENISSDVLYDYAGYIVNPLRSKNMYLFIYNRSIGSDKYKALSAFKLAEVSKIKKDSLKWLDRCLKYLPNHRKAQQLKLQLQLYFKPGPIKVILGGADKGILGWTLTDKNILNLNLEDDWLRIFKTTKADFFFSEHVWEHLTKREAKEAIHRCFRYLKPGGVLRLAVPDGFHPSSDYIDKVKPGGSGPGAKDHRVLYNYRLLKRIMEQAGFDIELVEYFDEKGQFYQNGLINSRGRVLRSSKRDKRNKKGTLNYTSLIIDGIKPR